MTSLLYTHPTGLQMNERTMRYYMQEKYDSQWFHNSPGTIFSVVEDCITVPEFYIECGIVAPAICNQFNSNSGFFYWCTDCEVYHVKMFSLN